MVFESHPGFNAADDPSPTLFNGARQADAAGEHEHITGGKPSDSLFLRHLRPAGDTVVREGRVVVFVHGATFPSAVAAAFRFGGRSWMDDLSEAGFDVWALDFAGYGGSGRYPEMAEPAYANAPPGRASQASRDLARAVAFITMHARVTKVSIIAHSWGTMVAGIHASEFPGQIDRLVLFGPIVMRSGPASQTGNTPAYHFADVEYQWAKFTNELPDGEQPKISARDFDRWWRTYLASDATSATRSPPSVQIPYGPFVDLADAWSGKQLPYDPARITAPTLIVRGEWDTATSDADARWLFHALRATPIKRDVVISRGTHVMHLEESRYQLYQEVQLFLEARENARNRQTFVRDLEQPNPTVQHARRRCGGIMTRDYTTQSQAAEPTPPKVKAAILRDLHRSDRILLLPNAWDVASARIYDAAGFAAIGTTSAGIAVSMGYPDGERIPRSEMLQVVRRISSSTALPVSVDIEAGYGDTPGDVAETVRQTIEAGGVGINLEDGLPDAAGSLVDLSLQREKITAARETGRALGVPVVINARTDVYWLASGTPVHRIHADSALSRDRFRLAVQRANDYAAAGADCVFLPGVTDAQTIADLVREIDAPINVLASNGMPPVSELERLGIKRLSLGSGPIRAVMAKLQRIATELLEAGTYAGLTGEAIPYTDFNRLVTARRSPLPADPARPACPLPCRS